MVERAHVGRVHDRVGERVGQDQRQLQRDGGVVGVGLAGDQRACGGVGGAVEPVAEHEPQSRGEHDAGGGSAHLGGAEGVPERQVGTDHRRDLGEGEQPHADHLARQ